MPLGHTRKLVSQQDAAMIQSATIPRSKFIGMWTRKMAFDAGKLVPFMVDEVLPGDHLSYNVTAYVRMSTPLFPLFDNQRIDTHFFYVPCRILWENWAKMMGEQDEPDDTIAYTLPQIESAISGHAVGTLYDHMGIPGLGQVTTGHIINFNALPFRAYNRIYNDWFRDQNLLNSLPKHTDDGPDPVADYIIQRRAKSHDYFTSALPWPQKFTAPNLPLTGLAPVVGLGTTDPDGMVGPVTDVVQSAGPNVTYTFAHELAVTGNQNYMQMTAAVDGRPAVFADLAQVSGVAINTLRQAWLVQSLLERDARGGTRYVELIRSHFGVTSPDFRLQRPEYIGGGQSPLQITPIAQTAPTETEPLGALGAAGTSVGQHRANYAATEHGYIIALISVKSELSYQQGLHKMWSRQTRYDFYWPALAGLGEQAILRQELYATGDPGFDELVFGYQERWHEYRTRTSEVTGVMRSTAATPIDQWHLAQEFATPPTLGLTFIQDNPPMSRVLAAGSEADGQQYLADIMINRTAVRPIPQYGTPVNLGRF